ncbi:hypothetical protein EYC98_18025 [Halieaceae bacterium IMCC14734]|uniref:DUF2232 domain-containing protein n=1 Tax=Candidatus Litorirhabdus singularis TaxID=2518993 RepID=A0ABT3TKD6_9GAMM|nr:hypothetical protein [Candidatus Litorirhabdus singularis]MCX2982764.1 hypothetical protein [Candidatus Litorirhabdus singularis]
MRGLAEFVMRGRPQALLVGIIGASSLMFAWVSAAVVALVTLRKGTAEGASLLAWLILPAGFLLALFGDPGPLGLILGTAALAFMLRSMVAWQPVLLGAIGVGAVSGLLMLWFAEPQLQMMVKMFEDFFANLQADMPDGQQLPAPGIVTLAGMLGLMNAVTCVLSLLLARYWQALLYNPGGFRDEFHALRLSPQVALLLAMLMLAVGLYGFEYRPWAVLFAVPLSVAGIAFIHARAAYRGLGIGWLSMFYVFWLVLDPVKMVVIAVAVADSLMNFRGRWQSQGGNKD